MSFIIVPLAVGAMGLAWLIRMAWQKMWEDERGDLNAQAELVVEVISSRLGHFAHRIGELQQENYSMTDYLPPDMPPGWDRFDFEGPGICGPRGSINVSDDDLVQVCYSFASTNTTSSSVAFKVVGDDGRVRFVSSNYPSRTGVTGSCRTGPPIGECTLVVARADGGADMRLRAALFLVLGIGSTLLIACALSLGGILLIHMLRKEQRDAQRKTDFFDNVSHELRTPLAGIRLNAELLSQNRIPDEERRKGALYAILIESDRLGEMVESLLNFRRLEKGTHRYKIESFDLAEFAGAPSELQAITAVSRGRSRIEIKGPGVVVEADKNAIRQIGVNLVTNAVKYSSGLIDIVVDGAEVHYMDRGPGVPHGDEERIFERYYRVDNSIAQQVSGSGIGLPIARTLARGMGGDIVYAHRLGGGSVFTLKLKRA